MNNFKDKNFDKNVIKEKIKIAIDTLFSNDAWLLEKDLNERSITHKLAEYMQPLFSEFNVDCEYNGNVLENNDRKQIKVLKEELLKKYIKLNKKEINETDYEFAERLVFPDIIVHKRGEYECNLCVIEVKKSTSKVSAEFDKIKLQAYTNDRFGNNLKYELGVFIEFMKNTNDLGCKINYFSNGKENACEAEDYMKRV